MARRSAGLDPMSIAASLVDAVARSGGRTPPPGLRITGASRVDGIADLSVPGALVEARGPGLLGALYEAALTPRARDAGAHYTPADLAARLVALAPPAPSDRAWDPACGGGAFLLAAADALVAAGADPEAVVADQLWGTDVDPGAVAVAEAALCWWAADHGVEAAPGGHLAVADPLLDRGPHGPLALAARQGFDLVVGNPPFQGQLAGASVRSAGATSALRERWGTEVVRPYTDAATLFLVAGADALAPGGRLVMIQPTSVLAARDAAPARRAVGQRTQLTGLWVAGELVFGAAVQVCAIVASRPGGGGAESLDPVVRRWRGRTVDELAPTSSEAVVPPSDTTGASGSAGAGETRWAGYALAALGIPDPPVRAAGRLGELVTARAGFRDEYYGLVGHVAEAPGEEGPDHLDAGWSPLVTSGLVEPGRCCWGERPASFARTRYRRPAVDLGSLAAAGGRAASWVSALAVPKVVVATQTKVGEAAVDATGRWVPSTPTIAVTAEPDRLWHVAAVICSPVGSVAALGLTAGSARAGDAIRHSVASVAGLPLPVDRDAWDAGAAALRARDQRSFVDAMAAAYAVVEPAELHEWWVARAPWPA